MAEPRPAGEVYGHTFDECFHDLLFYLNRYPDYVAAPRGRKVRECLAQTVVLTDPRARLITNPERKPNYGFAAGEFLWYLQGRQDLEMMLYYNKKMGDYSDDGRTLGSAYGWRLMKSVVGYDRRPPTAGRSAPPLTQWDVAIMTLVDDPDSRRAVLHINEPADEVQAVTVGSKDVPCTMGLQFLIRDNQLHLHVHMRSNDVVWGLTNDLFSFTLLQELMLLELREGFEKFRDLELGTYYHTAGSMHIYERHFEMADRCLGWYDQNVFDPPAEPMPMLTSRKMLDTLCIEEERLRKRYIDTIYLDQFKGGERWLATQLNLHRQKRDAEESLKQEQKAD